MNAYDLSGRVALVTGGASGIGKAVTARLRESGATVASCDLVAAADVDLALVGNVTDRESVDGVVGEVLATFGRIDVLVCAAGILGNSERTADIDDVTWRRVFDVNLTGVLNANRAVIATMVERGYGRVVNVSSIAGKEGNPMDAAYSASKAAVISLTKSIGKDLAGTGVIVNCVTPGPTETAMIAEMADDRREYVRSRIPLGRLAQPSEIASLVTFLCSQELSFTTGAVIDCSGGRAVY